MTHAFSTLKINTLLKQMFTSASRTKERATMTPFPPRVPPPPHGSPAEPPPQPEPPGPRIATGQWRLATFLIAAMVLSIGVWHFTAGIEYTGILFIAVPTTMAALLALVPRKTSTYGAFTGTMIAVLASSLLIREGFICVLMALPLIIPVALLASYSNRQLKESRSRGRMARTTPTVRCRRRWHGVRAANQHHCRRNTLL